MLRFVKFRAGKVRAANLAIANIPTVESLQIPIISHVYFESIPFTSPAIISKSSSTHNSVEAMIFLTQIKPPPPRADLSLLKVVKSALKTSALLISSLSHDSVPITTKGFTCQINFRIVMLYYILFFS